MSSIDYRRKYESSPNYQWENSSSITDDNLIRVSWETEDTTTQKYLPFNFTRIINNGETDIYFYPNQDEERGFLVPKGTIQSFDGRTIPALSSFAIKRATATTITANKIVISNHKEGQTADSIVQRLHKRVLGGL